MKTKLKKIDEFIITETNTKVVIIGDVETNGKTYAEAVITFSKMRETL